MREAEDIVPYFVLTFDGDSFVGASKYVTYGEGLRVAIIFLKG